MSTHQKPADTEEMWGASATTVRCGNCRAAHLVLSGPVPTTCPRCLQGLLEPQPAVARPEPPEQAIRYRVGEEGVRKALEGWAAGSPFRPTEMDPNLLTRRARRYLLPAWLLDVRVRGTFRADVGEDYETVSYQDRYREGVGWRSQKTQESRVHWEARAGRIDRGYNNVAVPVLAENHGPPASVGAFDLEDRVEYDPRQVPDAIVPIPVLGPEESWHRAEATVSSLVEEDCRLAASADHIRDFTLDADFEHVNWTQLLLPAYFSWYAEGQRRWPVLVNGQNGDVVGVRRASARKATTISVALGGLAALVFVIGGLLALAGALFPPGAVVGAVMLLAALVLGVAAPVPVIRAWAINKKAEEQLASVFRLAGRSPESDAA